tara:strand:- start:406 stop:681 length:276 start_codon:yes stop_codon:yes gene_type:complete
MKIKIQLPEIFVICSTALLISNSVVAGWVFFSLGILGSLFRLGIKMQEQQQQAAAVKDSVDVLKGSADEFLNAINDAMSGKKNNVKKNNLN